MMHSRQRRETARTLRLGVSAAALALAAAVGVAEAQTVPAPSPNGVQAVRTASDSLEPTGLQEVVVTARKRAERLQDVPESITAFTSSAIHDLNLRDITDLSLQTPGFAMQNYSRQAEQIVIRGLPPTSVFRPDQDASFFIDGVYVGGIARTIGLDDVDRIEVILGPQAVQFGRATFAGAVNYISRKPSDTFHVDAQGRIGEHGLYDASGSISGPLLDDKLAFRLYGQHHEYQGEYRNQASALSPIGNQKLGTEQTNGLSASLRWNAAPTFHVTGRAQYTEFRDGDSATGLYPANTIDNCVPNSLGQFQYHCGKISALPNISLNLNYAPFGGFRHTNQFRSEIITDWQLGKYTVTGVTAYNSERAELSSDGDGLNVNAFFGLLNSYYLIKYYDESADLRIASPVSDRFHWLAGFYGYRSLLDQNTQLLPSVAPANLRATKDYAFYGSAAYEILPKLTLTGEARFQDEVAELRSPFFHHDYQKFLPRVTLDYKFTPEVLTYVLAAKGDKPGAFNAGAGVPTNLVPIQEETLVNYEGGFKTAWLHHRLTADLSAYYIDWVNQAFPVTVIRRNADGSIQYVAGTTTPNFTQANVNNGSTHIKGFEFDSSYLIIPGWSARFAASYTDSRYARYNAFSIPGLGNNPNVGSSSALYTPYGNTAGNYLPANPKYKFIVSTQYRRPAPFFPSYNLTAGADAEYRAKQYTDATNLAYLAPVTLVNARVGFENARYSVEFYGRNLTNNRVPDFATQFADYSANTNADRESYLVTLRPSRAFGVLLTYKSY